MKRVALLILVVLLLVVSVFGVPYLELGDEKPEELQCSTYLSGDREFFPTTNWIDVGVVCKDTARVDLYECVDNSCEELVVVAAGYKVKGVLPRFQDFTYSNRYHYDCFTCREPALNTAPIIEVAKRVTFYEGQTVQIDATCKDLDGDHVFVSQEGWMTQPTKLTEYDDAGMHRVKIVCRDEFDAVSTKEVLVRIIDRNRPPIISSVKNE